MTKTNNMPNIRKEEEFDAFIEMLEEGTDALWIEVAETLGVDKDTITRWKKHPKAIEARKRGINYAVREMQNVGRRDWRMWESKLKMLGIIPKDRTEVEHSGDENNPIKIDVGSMIDKVYGDKPDSS